MKIIKLTAENFKKLKAVEITPDGNTVIVSGRNEQGKSSVLDAIWTALGGARAMEGIKKPIREGARHAEVTVELDEIVVTRTWTNTGTYLSVTGKENKNRINSPQAVLDALVGKLTFDPLAFTRMSEKDQRDTLMNLVDLGIDLDKLAQQRQGYYDTRTDINRDLKTATAQLELLRLPPNATIPEKEVDTGELAKQLRAIHETNNARASVEAELTNKKDALTYISRTSVEINKKIQETEQEIERLHKVIASERADLERNEKLAAATEKEVWDISSRLATMPKADAAEIEKQLEGAEDVNRLVRIRQNRDAKRAEVDALEKSSKELTRAIEDLDYSKQEAVRKAKMPIADLSFTDEGVTYRDIPFSQCSAAEQLRVSLAIGMAMNPKLRILRIMDGSLLDSENLAVIKAMADEKDFQIWMEIVDESGKVGVYIEEGEIKARGGE